MSLAAANAQDYELSYYDDETPPAPNDMLQDAGDAYDGSCGGQCCGSCQDCGPRFGIDTFFGVNAVKNPLDDTRGNNFGLLASASVGMKAMGNIGFQIGGSFAAYDLHGRHTSASGRSLEVEQQTFVTAGVFKRANLSCGDCWTWGVVWDYFTADGFGEDGRTGPNLHQIRAQIGYAINCCNEVGFMGNTGIDNGTIFDSDNPNARVNILDQYTAYWKRTWCNCAETTFYAGVPSGEPSEFVFGFTGVVPLDCNFALVGGWHYVLPSVSGGGDFPNAVLSPNYRDEIWNVYFGMSYAPGKYSRCCNPWMPLMQVANNGTMPMVADPNERF